MDPQIENLVRALQEVQENTENAPICLSGPSSVETAVGLGIVDNNNHLSMLQDIFHTSSFLQRQDSEAEGSIGYNITRHSILSIIQNPYMCAMCGAIFAFSGNLTKHIKGIHSPRKDPGDAKAASETDENQSTRKKRGRPKKAKADETVENKENVNEVDPSSEESGNIDKTRSGRPRREVRVPQRYLENASEERGKMPDENDDVKHGDTDAMERVEGMDVQDGGGKVDAAVKRKRKAARRDKLDWTNETTNSLSEIYRPYPCEFCDKTFRNFKQRSNHRTEAHPDESFSCKDCKKEFPLSKFWRYQRHCQAHARQGGCKTRRQPEEELVCDICGTSVTTASCLSIHKQNLHPEAVQIEKPFACTECGKGFRTKYLLKSHTDLVHTDDKPFFCSMCNTCFKTKQYLEIHFRIHTGEKPFQCRFCMKKFRTTAGRRKHERTHTKERPYKCRYCEKEYYTKASMLEHTTSAHTQDRPLMCEICGKTFVHRASLRQHKFLHTGQKPFVCKFCSRAFSQKINLQDHVRSLHTHEKPYKCGQCEMSFSRSTGRNEHMRKKHKLDTNVRQHTLSNFHTHPVEQVEISGLEVEF